MFPDDCKSYTPRRKKTNQQFKRSIQNFQNYLFLSRVLHFPLSGTFFNHFVSIFCDILLHYYFLIGIHSMQGWTATTRHGAARKIRRKWLKHYLTETLTQHLIISQTWTLMIWRLLDSLTSSQNSFSRFKISKFVKYFSKKHRRSMTAPKIPYEKMILT